MKKLPVKLSLMIGLLLTSMAAWAIEPDELRGRIISVNEGDRTLTVHVLEVGSEVQEPVNTDRTYNIPESVEIQDGIGFEILDDRLGDLHRDEIVTMEIDVDGNASRVRYPNESDA